MAIDDFTNPANGVVFAFEVRNRIAQSIIEQYVTMHRGMDVGIGLIGLIPGAAIPALMTSIALQPSVIYQPMAKKLAAVYLADADDLDRIQSEVVSPTIIQTAAADMAADFGVDFLIQIAGELAMEAGVGAAATLLPVVGAFAGATLDYVIATTMTRRVGAMVSIYFQNGGEWVGSKDCTYKAAKSVSDLNGIRHDVAPARQWLLKNVRAHVENMRHGMTSDQIRQILSSKGIPADLLDEAL